MSADEKLWNKEADDLINALLSLKTRKEARCFFRDLLTTDEIRMVVDRWRVARMLDAGLSYKQIEQQTKLSSRTIARISRWLKEGEGGYRKMLTRRGKG